MIFSLGGAVLAKIHMDYKIPGGIVLKKYLYRFFPNIFKNILQDFMEI